MQSGVSASSQSSSTNSLPPAMENINYMENNNSCLPAARPRVKVSRIKCKYFVKLFEKY